MVCGMHTFNYLLFQSWFLDFFPTTAASTTTFAAAATDVSFLSVNDDSLCALLMIDGKTMLLPVFTLNDIPVKIHIIMSEYQYAPFKSPCHTNNQ